MPEDRNPQAHAVKKKFFAVATTQDETKEFPDLAMLNWIPLKSRTDIVWKNSAQLHFNDQSQAQELYDVLKQRNLTAYKNWH